MKALLPISHNQRGHTGGDESESKIEERVGVKRLSEFPPPPQLSPQWLINTIPTFTAQHPPYFLSFPPFYITEPHSIIFILPCAFISDQISLIALPFSLSSSGIHPALHPCPSYFLKPTALCLHICPDLRHCQPPSTPLPLLFSFPPSLHLFLNPF